MDERNSRQHHVGVDGYGGSEKSLWFCSSSSDDDLLAAPPDLGRRRLLGQKDGLNVGQHAALGDRDPRQKLVQLLVVADRQLEMTRNDSRLLVVAGGVAGQLEHLCGQVLHDRRQVDGGAGPDSLGVVALAQQSVDPADGKLKTGATRPTLRLRLYLAAFASSGHDNDDIDCVVRENSRNDNRSAKNRQL
jgi:hypothetical protein